MVVKQNIYTDATQTQEFSALRGTTEQNANEYGVKLANTTNLLLILL